MRTPMQFPPLTIRAIQDPGELNRTSHDVRLQT